MGRQRLITEFIKVRSYWWVPPSERDEFTTVPEHKPAREGGGGK